MILPRASPRRALLHLLACVAVALGAALSALWGLGRLQRRGIRRFEIDLDCERMEAQIGILCDWFARSPYRPRYSRREWIQILEYAERWGLTVAETSREFFVSEAAVHRWKKLRREGKLGPDVTAPSPPVTPSDRLKTPRGRGAQTITFTSSSRAPDTALPLLRSTSDRY